MITEVRYFKAFAIDVKPFIQWDCFANSEAEYMELGLNTDHRVMRESDIPANQYGVCPLRINESGELVARSISEMESYQAAYNNDIAEKQYKSQITSINQNTFDYEGQTFFMDELTRLAINEVSNSNQELSLRVRTTNGFYNLTVANIAGVRQAYHSKLQQILQE